MGFIWTSMQRIVSLNFYPAPFLKSFHSSRLSLPFKIQIKSVYLSWIIWLNECLVAA